MGIKKERPHLRKGRPRLPRTGYFASSSTTAVKSFQTFWHERQQAIYKIDSEAPIRQSHNNPCIKMIYEDFLGEPLGHKSHELLHTSYRDRKVTVKHDMKTIWEEIRG